MQEKALLEETGATERSRGTKRSRGGPENARRDAGSEVRQRNKRNPILRDGGVREAALRDGTTSSNSSPDVQSLLLPSRAAEPFYTSQTSCSRRGAA